MQFEDQYLLIEANNGEEAEKILAEQDVDLVITDVVMPIMNGKDLYNQLLEVRPDVKVLFMSGYTDHAIVHHGVLDKEVTFFQKPFASEALLLKVREVLDKG